MAVERSASEAAARTAYARAVDWFGYCGGRGSSLSDVTVNELSRTAQKVAPVAGLDAIRILVRDTGVEGRASRIFAAGAVVQVGRDVIVVGWDDAQADNPYDYGEGLVQLARVAAARAARTSLPWVPESVMLQPGDPAVERELGGATATSFPSYVVSPSAAPCDSLALTPELTTMSGRTSILAPAEGVTNVSETVIVSTDRAAARRLLAELRPTAPTCLPGRQVTDLGYDAGERSWMVQVDGITTAALQIGRVTAFVAVESGQSLDEVDDSGAQTLRTLLPTIEQRLRKAYGG